MRQVYCIFMSFVLCICLSSNCNSQTNTDSSTTEKELFLIVEIMPEFPGGEDARMQFLIDHLQYPVGGKNLQGTVIVSFIVETDGSITNIEILRSKHKLLDEEAIRVTKLMPKWKPGLQKGKPIRTKYNMPIRFLPD